MTQPTMQDEPSVLSFFVYEEIAISESVEVWLVIVGGGYGVTFEEYKKALSSLASGRSDKEIQHLYELSDRLAGVLFDMWRSQCNDTVE